MTRPRLATVAVLVALVAAGSLAGCGLKGALSLPEKSGNVVIRDRSTTAEGAAAPAEPAAAPPVPEKLPPPDLPHSNSGASR